MAGGVWFVNAVVSTRPTLPLIITPGFDIIKTTHVEEGEDEVLVAQFHLSTDLSTHCLRTLNGAGTR